MRLSFPLRITLLASATAVLSFLLLTSDPLGLLGIGPDDGGPGVNSLIPDTVQHYVSYAIFAVVLVVSLGRSDRRGLVVAGMVAFAHGAMAEWIQRYIPGRTCDARDLVANAFGILSGLAIILVARRISRTAAWLPL